MERERTVLSVGERLKFSCTRCGRCCSTGPNVALTIYDICRIAKHLGVDWRDLRGKYVVLYIADVVPIPVLRGLGDVCAFLRLDGDLPECSIYPARPMRCRLYPFQPVSPSNSNLIAYDKYCLGIGENGEVEPPWKLLREYYEELKRHYLKVYEYVFERGCDPLTAIERAIDEACASASA